MVYNMVEAETKGAKKMAVAVKPIKPTIITDPEIAREAVVQATTPPTEKALKKLREWSKVLNLLQKNED